MPRPRLAPYFAISLLCAAGLPVGATPASALSGARPSVTTSGSSALQSSQACSLPVTYDPFEGFRVGVPAGWGVSSLGGVIEVSKDSSGAEAALLYPAVLTKGLTPAEFFGAYIGYEQRHLASEGVKLSFKMEPSTNGLPLAAIQLETGRLTLAGFARAIVLPLRTQLGPEEVVFSAW